VNSKQTDLNKHFTKITLKQLKMKTKNIFNALFICVLVMGISAVASAQQTKMITQQPVYKMTTPIPENITTPDKVETPIGTLEFFDGIPDRETIDKVYDYVDRARAVQAFINMTPAVSLYNLREGNRDMGMGKSNQILIW
jgi:hypothetical protein